MTQEISTPAAGSGLAPGDAADPRDGPFTVDEIAEGADAYFDKERWVHSGERKIDVLSLRLQVGRGRSYAEVSRAFGMDPKTLLRWRSKGAEWPRSLSEVDRRSMARRIRLAALAREIRGEGRDDEALKAASEWRVAPRNAKPVWTSLGADGPRITPQTFKDKHNDGRSIEDDPNFHERQRVREQLGLLIQRMERELAADDRSPGGGDREVEASEGDRGTDRDVRDVAEHGGAGDGGSGGAA